MKIGELGKDRKFHDFSDEVVSQTCASALFICPEHDLYAGETFTGPFQTLDDVNSYLEANPNYGRIADEVVLRRLSYVEANDKCYPLFTQADKRVAFDS